MTVVLMVAILAVSTALVHAQDQSDIAKLKAHAENVVNLISGDKDNIERATANLLI